jgi:hypothetical protein
MEECNPEQEGTMQADGSRAIDHSDKRFAAEGEALNEKVPPHAHNVSHYQSLFGLDFFE